MTARRTYQHGAIRYSSRADLAERLVALYRRQNADDTRVVLGTRPGHDEAIARALDGSAVTMARRPDAAVRPGAALAMLDRVVRRLDLPEGGRVLLVTEPCHGTTAAEWSRWRRFEAAVNITLASYPVTVVCAYDARTSPEPVLDSIAESHGCRFAADGAVTQSDGRNPRVVLAGLVRRMPVPAAPPLLRLRGSNHLRELAELRGQVSAALAGVRTLVRTDFVTAVNEVLTNAHVHGASPVELTLWLTEGTVECRVIDHGSGYDDPGVGYGPGPHDLGRVPLGLWLARQTCDDLDTWRDGRTFTVRLATAVTANPAIRTDGAIARAEIATARAVELRRRVAKYGRFS